MRVRRQKALRIRDSTLSALTVSQHQVSDVRWAIPSFVGKYLHQSWELVGPVDMHVRSPGAVCGSKTRMHSSLRWTLINAAPTAL